jgi:hypothetical protein
VSRRLRLIGIDSEGHFEVPANRRIVMTEPITMQVFSDYV